ncbi:MAG: ureidoglycolate lyase [Roseinatronobacter sp.]
MALTIRTQPLTPQGFAHFGQVLSAEGRPDRIINAGLCGRWHDVAALDFGAETRGRGGISIFLAEPRQLPYDCALLERHPEGSQAFIPMHANPFLVIVAPDEQGQPGMPEAFVTNGKQGINFARGIWHGVLTPLAAPGLFAVIDRIGPTPNLQEYPLPHPFRVIAG